MSSIAKLQRRVLDISYRHKLSHIGSCLTALPLIIKAYDWLNEEGHFVLSSGHAGLALYVVLEDRYGKNAEALLEKHGIHPCRDLENKICVSTGGLGMGLPVAVGMALGTKEKVCCLISDGECAEGAIWEALSFKHRHHLDNLQVIVNVNGYSAYSTVDVEYLVQRLRIFDPSIWIVHTQVELFPFLKGLDSHYCQMSQLDYEETMAALEDK